MSKALPEIKESNGFNFITSIWIVPFIAIVIALWLTYQHYSQLGQKIEITFEKNSGLKAGHSQIKFKDVSIGQVIQVALDDDGDGIKVTARIDKEAIDYLNEEAKFWIIKPTVGMSGVSGLDTIISGTYINLYSKKKRFNKKRFMGLEQPYRLLADGEYFHLNASSSFNVDRGTPIFFKNMKAGYVEYVFISLDGKSVDVIVYIEKTYAPYIHVDTKFWVQSTLNINYANGQLDFTVAPASNLVKGGIEFSAGEDSSGKVPYDYIFRLYRDSSTAADKKIGMGGEAIREYAMHFDESIAKLKRDASVRYEKFDIGRVKDIAHRYNSKSHKLSGKVLISIDTSIFIDPDESNKTGEANLIQAVKDGLRASLQEHDPISGLLYINLSFAEDNQTEMITYQNGYANFPTISTQGSGLVSELEGLIVKLGELPLDDLIRSIDDTVDNLNGILETNRSETDQLFVNLNRTLEGINKIVDSREFSKIPAQLNKTMVRLRKTLRSIDSMMKSNGRESLLSSQLTETLKEVSRASRDTQKVLKKLEQKPNSLIFGD
ncbi:MAG: MlaD family protein [Campylobacterota bacterium]|nr:MlaD family protein [Campylobacterota bacterium]